MKLQSLDGAQVVLVPVRYESPEIQVTDPSGWYADWLVIRGEISMGDGREWSFEHPCLTTTEARRLGEWLREVSAGIVAPSSSDGRGDEEIELFTEPNLALSLAELTEDRARIRVHLSSESLPPWLQGSLEEVEVLEFFVVLDTSREEVAQAASEWEESLRAFPDRGLMPQADPGEAHPRVSALTGADASSERPLTDAERGLLSALLSPDIPGAVQLREQLASAVVTGQMFPGSPSFDLRVPNGAPAAPLPRGPIDTSGFVYDEAGKLTGWLEVWVVDGRLSGLEYTWVSDEMPTTLPQPAEIQLGELPVTEVIPRRSWLARLRQRRRDRSRAHPIGGGRGGNERT